MQGDNVNGDGGNVDCEDERVCVMLVQQDFHINSSLHTIRIGKGSTFTASHGR